MQHRVTRYSSQVLIVFAVILAIFGLPMVFKTDRPVTVIAEQSEASPAAKIVPQVNTPPVLRVGLDRNFPPFVYVINGRSTGFNVDMIQAVAKSVGRSVEMRPGAFHDLAPLLESGELDMIVGMPLTTENSLRFAFTAPFSSQQYDLFTRVNSPVLSLKDTYQRDILVQEGSAGHDMMRTLGLAARLITVENTTEALQRLAGGDYDAALLPKMQALYQIDRLKISGLQAVGANLDAYSYAIAVRPGQSDLLIQLNEGLRIIKADGSFDLLYRKWFGELEDSMVSRQVRSFSTVLLAIMLLLAAAVVTSWTLRRIVQQRTAQLEKSEQRYRALVENASEGVAVFCGDRVVFLNQRGQEMLGFRAEDLTEASIPERVYPEDREIFEEASRQLEVLEKHQFSLRLLDSKGEPRWVLVNTVRIHWNGLPATLALFADITEYKSAETRIAQQLEQMAALHAVDVAIAGSTDLHHTLRLVVEQVTRQLHADAADVMLLDRSCSELRYAAGWGFRTHAIQKARLYLGEGYAGIAAQRREPVRVATLRGAPVDMLSVERLAVEGFASYYGTPLIAKGEVLGVLEIYHRRERSDETHWLDLAETMAHQAAIAINNAEMFENLEQVNTELLQAYDRTIAGWARALELRDNETEGHSQRVTDLTVRLARRMNVSEEELVHIRRGALLHDIGKMGIPDSILLKQGPLAPEEWDIMRQHPVYAYDMLSHIPFLREALDIPYAHHEKWDGSGYPLRLKGEQIPLAARIFAVVDVWDALRANRPYRHEAWSESRTWHYLAAESGKHFDPEVVSHFLEMLAADYHHIKQARREPIAAD